MASICPEMDLDVSYVKADLCTGQILMLIAFFFNGLEGAT